MVPTLIFQLRAVPLPVSTAASTALSAAPAPASTYLKYFYQHKYFPPRPRNLFLHVHAVIHAADFRSEAAAGLRGARLGVDALHRRDKDCLCSMTRVL